MLFAHSRFDSKRMHFYVISLKTGKMVPVVAILNNGK
jgi:hypothetical protein